MKKKVPNRMITLEWKLTTTMYIFRQTTAFGLAPQNILVSPCTIHSGSFKYHSVQVSFKRSVNRNQYYYLSVLAPSTKPIHSCARAISHRKCSFCSRREEPTSGAECSTCGHLVSSKFIYSLFISRLIQLNSIFIPLWVRFHRQSDDD